MKNITLLILLLLSCSPLAAATTHVIKGNSTPFNIDIQTHFQSYNTHNIQVNWGDGVINKLLKHTYENRGLYSITVVSESTNGLIHDFDFLVDISTPLIFEDIDDVSSFNQLGVLGLIDRDLSTPIISGGEIEITTLRRNQKKSVQLYFKWHSTPTPDHTPQIIAHTNGGKLISSRYKCLDMGLNISTCEILVPEAWQHIKVSSPFGLMITEIVLKDINLSKK